MNFHLKFTHFSEWRTIQRDLHSLEEQTHRNITVVSNDKCAVLRQGWGNPMHWYRLGMDWVGSSTALKT